MKDAKCGQLGYVQHRDAQPDAEKYLQILFNILKALTPFKTSSSSTCKRKKCHTNLISKIGILLRRVHILSTSLEDF
jgi:hypothetical protein